MQRRAALAIACLGLGLAAPAQAATPLRGWDGANPYNCTIQDVGRGTDFPDPKADPLCVRFDKTHQNVTALGIVDFLLREPARVAAAADKCFYYQQDHWTGSLIQGDARTELYNFQGRYFVDRGPRAGGGAALSEFRIAGQSSDPTLFPGFPADLRPYFGPGRGGALLDFGTGFEPRCVELAGRKAVYRSTTRAGADCRIPGGRIGRGIGGVTLGMRRAAARAALGAPTSESATALRWCLEQDATLAAGYRSASPGARALIVRVDHAAFTTRGLAVGATTRTARRALTRERRSGRLLIAPGRRRTLVAAVAGGRVRWIAVARPRIGLRALRRDLKRLG